MKKLYETYVQRIFRYAYFHLNNKEKAEDATSETVARFFETQDPNGLALWMDKNNSPNSGGVIRITTFDLFDECSEGSCTYENVVFEMKKLNSPLMLR